MQKTQHSSPSISHSDTARESKNIDNPQKSRDTQKLSTCLAVIIFSQQAQRAALLNCVCNTRIPSIQKKP